MPPEPPPWDRRDPSAFKDRKRDSFSSDVLTGGGSLSSSSNPRWRAPYPSGGATSPRRPPPTNCRQGGGSSAYYQVYPGESTGGRRGCSPSRSEDGFGTPSSRYKESRGLLGRSPCWGSGDLSRQLSATALRSVAVPVSPISYVSSQPPSKDQHDGVNDGSATGRRYERDLSIGWKPRQWARSCSLSSKAAKTESGEARIELPVLSTAESPLVADEGAPRKKPRLTWGQGLAKHEKKKIEGSSDTVEQSRLVHCGSSANATPDSTSPKLRSFAGCTTPGTLCSAISSSSPAVLEEKPCIKESNNGGSRPSDSSCRGLQDCSEEFYIKLYPLEVSASSNLTSLLADLLQPEDSCSGDSSFTSHTAMNKLLVLKGDISKELEKTECEIDLLENELKTLNADVKNVPCQSSFSSQAAHSTDPSLGSTNATLNTPLDFTPSKDTPLASHVDLVGESGVEVKYVNDDNLVSVSPTPGNSVSSVKGISEFSPPKLTGCHLDGAESLTIIGSHGNGSCIDAGSSSVYADSDMRPNSEADNNLIASIMASNKDTAKKSSQVFDKALSSVPPQYEIWGSEYILSCRRNDARVREKIAMYKRLFMFKERVLGLKFRVFQHSWKEDLQLLSKQKIGPKSQKRIELSSRSSQCVSQRHQSTVQSLSMLSGNSTPVTTTEAVDFTRKLLSRSNFKPYRKSMNMPALILDPAERKYSKFISYNGLIEDPTTFEKERALMNPWTEEEKKVFMEMLAKYGKDFTKISSFLAHKTTADCIEFYYKNHKSEVFYGVKQQLDLRKQRQCIPSNTYLVTSEKKWNREVGAASLDMLDKPSVVGARNSGHTRNKQKRSAGSVSRSYHELKVARRSRYLENASSVDVSMHDRETSTADVLAGICSSEAMSSCITSSTDPAQNIYMTMDRPLVPKVTQNFDEEDTCSGEGCGELVSVDWTDEEKSLLIRAFGVYGKDFLNISRFVGTRSREQCKIFFSKARKSLGLNSIHPRPAFGDTPMSDTNGVQSDTDDACAPAMVEAICSRQSCSKLDDDFAHYGGNTSSEAIVPAGNIPVHSETDRPSEPFESGGINHEDVEGKVDTLTPVTGDENLSKEPGASQSDNSIEEKSEDGLTCNETIQFHEVTEFVNGKAGGVNYLKSAPVKPVTTAYIEAEQSKSCAAAQVQEGTRGSSPVNELKTVVDSQQYMLSEQQSRVSKNAINNFPSFFGSDESGNISSSGEMVAVSYKTAFSPNYQHQFDWLSHLQKKPHIQLKQDNSTNLPSNKCPHNSSSICSEDLEHVASQSILNTEDQNNNCRPNLVATDDYHPCLMDNLSASQVKDPLNILRGFPLQVFSNKEVKRNVYETTEVPVLLDNITKVNAISQPIQFLLQDANCRKNSDSLLLSSGPGIYPTLRSENQLETQLRPCSQTSGGETGGQSHRTGDVRLFGQILSHPSFKPKQNFSLQECGDQLLSPEQTNSSIMKPSNIQKDVATASRPSCIELLAQAELPLRSYGFWDGNNIQTGFLPLPESTAMLEKYQDSLAGASFYPAKDGVLNNTGVLTDYRKSYMQNLVIDGKWLPSLPELQKRNGFGTVPGFQLPGAAVLGANMMGREAFFSGAGTGISDPVAALRLHYARRTKNPRNDSELWKGDGDR